MGCWPRTRREIKGIEKAATWPDFWGQWLVPRSSEEWRGRGAVSPQVLGRCSEATKMGPPAGPASWGEGDVDVRLERFHQAGASGCLLSTWGRSSPCPSVSSCPLLSTPSYPQEVWSSTDLLGARWGEAWSWGKRGGFKAFRARRTVYMGLSGPWGPRVW